MPGFTLKQTSSAACVAVIDLAAAFAIVLALVTVPAHANPQSGPAPGTAAAVPAAAAPESRACRKAKARVASEERSVAKVKRSIDQARAGSTTCTTKPVCDRYATKIEELETRRDKREAKLAKYRSAADHSCKAP